MTSKGTAVSKPLYEVTVDLVGEGTVVFRIHDAKVLNSGALLLEGAEDDQAKTWIYAPGRWFSLEATEADL